MKPNPLFRLAATVALLCAWAAFGQRVSPSSVNDPAADATQLYSWVQGQNLVIVADFIGLEQPEGGPTWARFDENVLYEIHLVRGPSSLDDTLTWQFRFTAPLPIYQDPNAMPLAVPPNTRGSDVFSSLAQGLAFQQTYTVTQLTNGANPTVVASNVAVPPPNVGPRTSQVVYGLNSSTSYENAFGDLGNSHNTIGALAGGGQVFAGPRDDPWFEDEGAIDDLFSLRPIQNPSESARNAHAYLNTHAIVLEIPLTVANGGTAVVAGAGNVNQIVGVWASASRRAATVRRPGLPDLSLGPWRQVSRVGLPLFQAWYIGIQDRDRWSRATPKDDITLFASYLLDPVIVRDVAALGYYAPGQALNPCAGSGGNGPQTNRTDLVQIYDDGLTTLAATGDVLRVDLGTASGFPNGRLLTDHVTDITAAILLCGASSISSFNGVTGPTSNEPEAPLPKTSAGNPVFPYLQPPWDGRSANMRLAPSLP